jgi:hypothetical protein
VVFVVFVPIGVFKLNIYIIITYFIIFYIRESTTKTTIFIQHLKRIFHEQSQSHKAPQKATLWPCMAVIGATNRHTPL